MCRSLRIRRPPSLQVLSRLVPLVAALGLPAAVHAGEINFDTLVDGKITLPLDFPAGEGETNIAVTGPGTCEPKQTRTESNVLLAFEGQDCKAVLASTKLEDLSVSVNFQRGADSRSKTLPFGPKLEADPVTAGNEEGSYSLDKTPVASPTYYYVDPTSKAWVSEVDLDKAAKKVLAGVVVYVWDPSDSGKFYRLEVESTSNVTPDSGDFVCPLPGQPLTLSRRSRTVCVTISEEQDIEIQTNLPHVIGPNTSVRVVVRRPAGTRVGIKMEGTPGVFRPGLHRSTLESSGEATAKGGGREKSPKQATDWVESVQSFAPRPPGRADIKVEVSDDNKTVVAEKSFELIVDRSYVGALRLGFGVVFPNALDASYSAEKRPGSDQLEIVATHSGRTDFELIVGFAPFAFDFLRRGKGRRYTNQPLRRRALGLAPFIGTGLLAVDGQGAEFLKSLHLGLEWEPLPQFSFALTAVGRRVDRLRSGLRVGSAVAADTELTRMGVQWGMGLVINVTPDFFRFANAESKELLKGETNK